MTVEIVGRGTSEAQWTSWLDAVAWPTVDLAAVAGRRVVVLAAHPDDEVLGVGGLLRQLTARHHIIVMVWATDGEASHPDTTTTTPADLAARRRLESAEALRRLGVRPAAVHHLGLPDGRLDGCREILNDALRRIVCPGDLLIAPWARDGHPDHDVVGELATGADTLTWHYPIWMWHWAEPDDPRVDWARLRSVPHIDVDAKSAAIASFVSQVEPLGPAAADAAILPPHVVDRFLRSREWVFT